MSKQKPRSGSYTQTQTNNGATPMSKEASDVQAVVEPEVVKPAVAVDKPKVFETPVLNAAPKANAVSAIEQSLLAYSSVLKPSSTSEMLCKGGEGFFKLLRKVLATNDPDQFRREWTTILNFVNKHRDLFREDLVFSGPAYWSGSEVEYTVFRRLMYLVLATAEPSKRRVLSKTINPAQLGVGMTAVERENLNSYYG